MLNFTEQLGNLLLDLVSKGFQFPIHMTSLAPNGSTLAGRFEGAGTFEQFTEHLDPEGWRVPVYLLFVDSHGEAEYATLPPQPKRMKVAARGEHVQLQVDSTSLLIEPWAARDIAASLVTASASAEANGSSN